MRRAAAAVLLSAMLLVIALMAVTRSAWFQARLETEVRAIVAELLNMTVEWERARFDPLSLRVELTEFRAYSGKTTEGTPFLQSPLVSAELSWPALLNRTLEIDPIVVHDAVVRFGNDGDRWVNFLDIDKIDELASRPSDGQGGLNVIIRRVQIKNMDVDFFVTTIDLRARLNGMFAEGRFDELSEHNRIPIHTEGGHGLYRMFGRDFQVDDINADLNVEIIKGPWVDLNVKRADIRASYPNATLHASGRIVDVARKHIFHLKGSGDTELNFLNDVFFDTPRLTGSTAFSATYDGDFEHFRVAGEVDAESLLVEDAVVSAISARAEVTENQLIILRASANAFDGAVSAKGALSFETDEWNLDAETSSLDLAQLRETFPALPPMSGRLSTAFVGEGSLADVPSLMGETRLVTPALRVRAGERWLDVPEGEAAAFVMWRDGVLTIEEGRVQTTREQVLFSGWYEPESDGIDINLSLESGDLSVLRVITGFPVEGWGTAEGLWRGKLTEPEFEFSVALSDIGLPWFRADTASGTLAINLDRIALSDVTASVGSGEVWLTRGLITSLSGEPHVELEVRAVNAPLEKAIAPLLPDSVPVTGEFTGTFTMSSPVSSPTATAEGTIERGSAWREKVRAVEGRMELRDGVVSFPSLTGQGLGGALQAEGRVETDGETVFEVKGQGLDLSRSYYLEGFPLTGTADAQMSVRVRKDQEAAIDAWVKAADLTLAGVPLGRASGDLQKRGKTVMAQASGERAAARLSLSLEPGYPGVVSAAVNDLNLSAIVNKRAGAFSELEGSARGEYRGPLAEWRKGAANAEITKLRFESGRLKLRSEGPVPVEFGDEAIRVKSARISGDGTNGTVSGTVGLDGSLNARYLGSLELQFFTLFIEGLKSAEGAVNIDGNVRGTLERPQVSATLKVRDGRVNLVPGNLVFDGIQAAGVFRDGQLVIDDMRARLGAGTVQGGGLLTMDGFSPKTVSLFANLNEAEARIPEWLLVRANGRVEMTGPIDHVLMRGDLEVVQAYYSERLDWESLILRFKPASRAPLVLRNDTGFHVDLSLHSAGSIFVRNNLADLKLRGDLQVQGYPPNVGVYGNLQVVVGTFIFRENTFTVQTGQINFADPEALRPVIDLRAKTRVEESTASGVRRFDDITVDANGPPDDLRIDLTSSPPLSRENIISLLYIRRRADEDIGGTDTARNEAVSLAFKLNENLAGFQSEVQEYFGFENLVLEPAFTDTSRSGTLKLRAEKTLSKDLKASLSTSLSSTDLNFWLSYGLTENLVLDSGWNSVEQQELRDGASNIGNFKVRPRLHFEFQ